MQRTLLLRLAATTGVVVACSFFPARIAGADESARKDIAIAFDDDGVHPPVSKVAAGGSVAFDNNSESLAAVVFPKKILKDLECKDARPDWQYESENLVSMPLRGDAPNLVLPCALKTGEYGFTVRLFDDRDDMDNPKRTLEGKIVVE
jgi:hypothetical protein